MLENEVWVLIKYFSWLGIVILLLIHIWIIIPKYLG